MTFLYGLCAYNQVPLAEFDASSGGNHKNVARELLTRMKFDGTRAAFDQDHYIFSCLSETNHVAIIVLTDRGVNANTRFYAVDQIRQRFVTKYLSSMSSAGELSKSAEFAPEIQRIFRECQSPSAAKIAQINANITSAQQVMSENLSRALERSEKLEVMESKAQEIRDSSQAFSREATSLRKAMCFQRYKWYIIIAIAVIVVIAVIVIVVVLTTKSNSSSTQAATQPPAALKPPE
jgi:vesicle-associated membrane protein 7